MSDVRSGARQTAAPALTMTRRQQKRARHQQNKQNKRRTAPPAARQMAAARQSVTTGPTARTLVAAPPQRAAVKPAGAASIVAERDSRQQRPKPARAALQPPAPKGQPQPGARRQKQPTAPAASDSQEMERQPAQSSVAPVAPRVARRGVRGAAEPGEHDDTRAAVVSEPALAAPRMSKRTRLIPSVRRPETPDSPSASGRKFPTLARMTAAVKIEAPEPGQGTRRRDSLATRRAGDQPRYERVGRLDGPAHGDSAAAVAWDEVRPEPAQAAPVQSGEPRRPVPTRRLRDETAPAEKVRRISDETQPHERARRFARPKPLPQAELVMPVAVAHAGVAAAAALTGAAMLVLNASGALWPLTLTVITGAGGGLAYALDQRRDGRRWDVAALLASQIGVMVWLLTLLGPRAALLTVVPALALLALRMVGRGAALAVVVGAFALYLAYAMLALGGVVAPVVTLDAGGGMLADGLAAAAGLGATLFGLLHLASDRARMDMAAQARLYESRVLRARLAQLTQQVEDDGERLDAALGRALQGSGISAIAADGMLSPLAETVGAAADRLQTLQRDREDRLRLEGAVRAVTRAVERAWLGLPWAWPEWSGTPMDELVALLRTPRPSESREAAEAWSEETPTLLQLPALNRVPAPIPWGRETAPVYPYGARAANGWSQPLAQPYEPFGTTSTPPARTGAQITPLPWNEWNQWPGWEGRY